MHNQIPISDFFVPGKRAHLVGIGGVSMASLAEVLHGAGVTVKWYEVRDHMHVDSGLRLGVEPPREEPSAPAEADEAAEEEDEVLSVTLEGEDEVPEDGEE